MMTIDMKEAIRLCKEAESLNPDDRTKICEERLKKLVNYAGHHPPYLKNYIVMWEMILY